jgi:uncharacterized protein YdeI (YjbR/CyaY-like superfamily)
MSNTSVINRNNITSEDTRTVKQYLRDVAETEKEGKSPEYSKQRKLITKYWKNAIRAGLVSPEDKMYKAIKKMRRAEKQQIKA